jgi:Epoxide hydrolase N terminus/Transposase IS116/IS110/IS902 family
MPAPPRLWRCVTRALRLVRAEDHVAMLRLLARRHHDLVAARTRAVCRLHTTLRYLAEGHFPKRMKAPQTAAILARIRPTGPVSVQRKALARDLLAEIRRAYRDLAELSERIRTAITASGTTVTDVFGVGPVVAAYLIGHSAHIARFPTAGHDARYNGTAPIEASSGPNTRHRLNPRGNRQLNWRPCEARLNALPQFITEIDGLDIHFIHVRSEHDDALPLIRTSSTKPPGVGQSARIPATSSTTTSSTEAATSRRGNSHSSSRKRCAQASGRCARHAPVSPRGG